MPPGMRLEIADFPVSEICFSKAFAYENGVLEVDRQELTNLILQDSRVLEVSFAVVHPGERVRVTGIRDVVEPRVKVAGQGQVFPGTLTEVAPVGEGRTHRLSGMAVFPTAAFQGQARAGLLVQRSAILDMWGPGAAASKFSNLAGLVLILKLAEELSDWDYHSAIQTAEFKTARRLAEVTIDKTPANIEVLDNRRIAAGLPKVVLVQGCIAHAEGFHSGISYYGMPVRESLATYVHPNELIDGVFASSATRAVGYFPITWDWQNHPLSLNLYRAHGKTLNFLGVVFERIQFEVFRNKEIIAQNTAGLVRQLGADGALVAWTGSGNAFVDLMLTVQACEKRGIRTVLVSYEFGGKDGIDSPLLFYVPEATAAVSTGSRDRWLELPEPERIIGPYERFSVLSYPGAPLVEAKGPLTLDARDLIVGGVDNWGARDWQCAVY
ncbi:MAG: hypothetical protein FJ145_02555 [Deltaproteobacteria bacterium]|nr:hypothetical protein [Deltaproteobacteria bacterium]